ncbi:hypothetical protein LCGC14_1783830 [marine sediment metagenome]|uniref:Uncharacterized protein n=1 Tax=marine sediment metagenome TaxID=412755 RepID=A0A0F9J9H9_9ZZZZ
MADCPIGEERVASRFVRILVEDGVKVYVAGQENISINRSAGATDVTTKDDQGFSAFIYGNKSWTASLDGVFIYDDATIRVFIDAQNADQHVCVQREIDNPDGTVRTEEGCAVVTAFNETASLGDSHRFSIELQGSKRFENVPCV